MKFPRSSGILLHISSLPGPYGIGDMGSEAFHFIDFLSEAGQSYWQILPLTPTRYEYGNSPYSGPSAFAGNILFISPEELVEDGLLEARDFDHQYDFPVGKSDYLIAAELKEHYLDKAYEKFRKENLFQKEFQTFCRSNEWLEDYGLYVVLKDQHQEKSWVDWPTELRNRQPEAMAQVKQELADELDQVRFRQFIFFRQWAEVRKYARKKGVKIIGDLPFYVNHDSVDCWANHQYFKLDAQRQPTHVSGVPPDYFSETGQLWGTPVYDWQVLEKDHFSWWVKRLHQNLKLYDVVRIDHFRAFSTYWEVASGEETAINGEWKKAPGYSFFNTLRREFPEMPFIAEDLGDLDNEVHRLREYSGLPGMRVLQFAFGSPDFSSPDLPHHHITNSIVYTGTHDNNTLRGWYSRLSKDDMKRFASYVGRTPAETEVNEVLIRMALMSVAQVAIIPIQDIINLGEEALMNRPGTAEGNWLWRLKNWRLADKEKQRLRSLARVYSRENKLPL